MEKSAGGALRENPLLERGSIPVGALPCSHSRSLVPWPRKRSMFPFVFVHRAPRAACACRRSIGCPSCRALWCFGARTATKSISLQTISERWEWSGKNLAVKISVQRQVSTDLAYEVRVQAIDTMDQRLGGASFADVFYPSTKRQPSTSDL